MKQKRLVELAAASSENPYVQKLLKDFLLANSIAESTTFNLYNYASKEQIRPAMTGILFKKGKKVVTDCYSLLCFAEPYDPSLEGKIIGPSGAEILESNFPDYQRIYPKKSFFEYKFSLEEISDICKQAKIEWNVNQASTQIEIRCPEESMYFDPKRLFKLVVYAKHIRAYSLKFYYDEKICLVKNNESWGVLMSMGKLQNGKIITLN